MLKNESTEFKTIRGRDYKIVYTARGWAAFRKDCYNFWEEIPAFTRQECKRFPVTLAKHAQSRFESLQESGMFGQKEGV